MFTLALAALVLGYWSWDLWWDDEGSIVPGWLRVLAFVVVVPLVVAYALRMLVRAGFFRAAGPLIGGLGAWIGRVADRLLGVVFVFVPRALGGA